MEPRIIQAGMGIGISNWVLANQVARCGQMGVVSGTAIDSVFVRRLQNGDLGGHIRRALQAFPCQEMAQRLFQKFYVEGGKSAAAAFARLPMLTAKLTKDQNELLVVANFVEVFLAKEGHSGVVGINLLEKIQMPVLPSLYGALLAGVDYVLMGAGIPREIPGVLDGLSEHQDVSYGLAVEGAKPEEKFLLQFSPEKFFSNLKLQDLKLRRPKFLAVISSTILAMTLAKRVARPVDGFVVEAPTAGGHNAPPRGKMTFNERGEPVYGERDLVDFKVLTELGLPFWLAGSRGCPQGLQDALGCGAQGVQVGTAFALCEESGWFADYRRAMLEQLKRGETDVYTDALASPTGFPFKVARMAGTVSEQEIYQTRERCCDLGYLRSPYRKDDGSLGYRCASEPVDAFIKKGGQLAETEGRKCLCNGLMATMGLAQLQAGGILEKPIFTIGDDIKNLGPLIKKGLEFSARDVISFILGEPQPI